MFSNNTIKGEFEIGLLFDEIEKAAKRLNGVVHNTPLLESQYVNRATGKEVFFKTENFQKGGSFKIRGAYNTIIQLDDHQKKQGIITHSSGNHAQAVAISGARLGIKTIIIMPENAPQVKIKATREYGAEVVLCESTMEAREKTCGSLIDQHGYNLIHPYDNDNIITGAATACKELVEAMPDLDLIIAPVGGGGLLSGTSIYAKKYGQNLLVYGAEPKGANDAFIGFNTGKRVTSQTPNTIADGLRTTLSARTFGYITEFVDEILTVTDTQIVQAMRILWERMKIVVEPSGSVPLASLIAHPSYFEDVQKVGLILSGGNVDLSNYFSSLTQGVDQIN